MTPLGSPYLGQPMPVAGDRLVVRWEATKVGWRMQGGQHP